MLWIKNKVAHAVLRQYNVSKIKSNYGFCEFVT